MAFSVPALLVMMVLGIIILVLLVILLQTYRKGLLKNVKSRRETERALQEQIETLKNERGKMLAILTHMTEGVIGVDGQLHILVINPSAESIFRVAPGTAAGKNLLQVANDVTIEKMMLDAISKKNHQTAEIELFYPEEKILKVTALGLPQAVSQMCGVLTFYDITHLRKLENMRRDFVANVSHELKTPLTSIHGFIETLLSGALRDPGKSESFLKMMQEDTQRLTRLIQTLLHLSEIESHESPLQLKQTDLEKEIRKTLEALQPRLDEKKIRMIYQFGASLPPVSADPDKLRQVLLNLLDNAIKFNKSGGQIKIQAHLSDHQVEISIQDSGIGIPPEAVARVFERFFRVDKARASDTGGTGLGLSIVKHLVEAHSGQVRCESKIGEGSIFSFTLPLA